MPKITILGAGITGMTIASQLPRDYDITIVGNDLPGDEMQPEYVSQWAGAIWLGTHDCSEREKQMQLGSLADLWKIAQDYPESSVRQIEMKEICDYGSLDKVWYRTKVPDFELVANEDLPKGAKFGMKYKTVVLTPMTFLPWFRARLEQRGVAFKRLYVTSLGDLKGMGHDVLINATGFGAAKLLDTKELRIEPIRQQNIRIRKPGYNKLYIRRGENGYYSTAFSRQDGTIYIGGIKTLGIIDFTANPEHRKIIMARQHANQPEVFPSPNVEDYEFICDHVGVFPVISQKNGGVCVEKKNVGSQKVVHAYGQEAGGYTFSFGLAREAVRLVQEYLAETPLSSSKL
ncbi:hypothetical protein NW759_013300 [Fusarium solani]|nr:hypothetical protein NW759_013300 [Fusarium solani]